MSQTTTLIRQLRAAGFTQTEIARQTGIPQPRLSRWENDEAPASADDVLRLAEFAARVLAPATAEEPAPEAEGTPLGKRRAGNGAHAGKAA